MPVQHFLYDPRVFAATLFLPRMILGGTLALLVLLTITWLLAHGREGLATLLVLVMALIPFPFLLWALLAYVSVRFLRTAYLIWFRKPLDIPRWLDEAERRLYSTMKRANLHALGLFHSPPRPTRTADALALLSLPAKK